MPQIYVDMDGVLADFDAGYLRAFGKIPDKHKDDVDWDAVRKIDGFYHDLPPMHDMLKLWGYVARYDPIVLTGVPKSVPEAPRNKIEWVRLHLGKHVRVICCQSKEKCQVANKSDLLIDDWEKYRKLWIDKGGYWITHYNAIETIRWLRYYGYS